MPIYNIRNTELVWRGLTMTGFSDVKISLGSDRLSNIQVIGISGECFVHPNPSRIWVISSMFNINSLSYPILEQDNLDNVEDTLIIRDLNIGTTDIYTKCTIMSITNNQDNYFKTVTWHAIKRNGR